MILVPTKRTDPLILQNMSIHYSQPKGFVGRNICYRIEHDDVYYGAIVGGSATLHLPGRDEFFNITKEDKKEKLLQIINNIFFHIEPVNNKYPYRNFSSSVIKQFREQVADDWKLKYGNSVIGFESLVEPPRTGELYKRDGWTETGITHGYTCKRVAGIPTDSSEKWTGGGRKVWDTKNLRPKLVFCKLAGEP